MYKQTLCVTLPISAAVIIAAALFANAGDLDPPEGPIQPTMHTLDEIYEAATAEQPCPSCTWEYWFGSVSNTEVQAISGAGVLHGLWIDREGHQVSVRDGLVNDAGPQIGTFQIERGGTGTNWVYHSEFFELNVPFETGITLTSSGTGGPNVTLLYRSTNL